MDQYDRQQQPVRRRRKKQLAPWERTLRRIWPPIRLLMVGAAVILLAVLLLSILISVFI